jgi:virulence-associated protein VapD
MTGFDYNGVVDTGNKRPSIDDVIITGNTDVKTTLDWLNVHNIQCAVYFPPKTMKSHDDTAAGVFKSDMIRLLGVTEFYEDKPEQIDIIKSSCPDCRVYRV